MENAPYVSNTPGTVQGPHAPSSAQGHNTSTAGMDMRRWMGIESSERCAEPGLNPAGCSTPSAYSGGAGDWS